MEKKKKVLEKEKAKLVLDGQKKELTNFIAEANALKEAEVLLILLHY